MSQTLLACLFLVNFWLEHIVYRDTRHFSKCSIPADESLGHVTSMRLSALWEKNINFYQGSEMPF